MKSQELRFEDLEPVKAMEKKSGGFTIVHLVMILLAALVVFSMFITPSAGYFKVFRTNTSRFHYYFMHFVRVSIGMLVGFVFYKISPRKLLSPITRFTFVAFSILFLIIVFPLTHGMSYHRWIPLGPFHFQVSEFTKVAIILFTAGYVARGYTKEKDFKRAFLFPLSIILANVALIVMEPNISTGIILTTIATAQLFIGRLRLRYIFGFLIIVALILVVGIKTSSNARKRFYNFIHKEQLKENSQVSYAIEAIKNGGLMGQGIGRSERKFFYLIRQADTDFIFAVIGEEMGFVGAFLVFLTYLLLFIFVVIKIKSFANDTGYSVLAFGIVFTYLIYALVNISTSLGFIPATGVPLPFISYGGSAMVSNFALAGILIRILREKDGTT